jgi:hypothetical protein
MLRLPRGEDLAWQLKDGGLLGSCMQKILAVLVGSKIMGPGL